MADRQGWVTLESCIYDYISEAELSQNKYFKLYHLAYRAMDDLGLDFFYQIKAVKLPINSNKTVTLPSDYRKYTKLGILNGNGELVPLKYNDNITTLSDINPNRIADGESTNFLNYYSPSSPVFFNYWNGSSYSNLYGVNSTSLYNGGFKIDEVNNVILLHSSFGYTGLVLEYMANPKEDEAYYVPAEFRETIVAWIGWRDIANLPVKRGSASVIGMRRHEYFEARRNGMRKYKPFYLDQAYIQSQQSSKLVIKS